MVTVHFEFDPSRSTDEHAANDENYRRAVSRLGAMEMEGQMLRVGASSVYEDRPRYWVLDGAKVYASFDDYVLD